MQFLVRFVVFSVLGILLGLSVASFGMSMYNRLSAGGLQTQLHNLQLETSIYVQNLTNAQTTLTVLNNTLNVLNITEIVYELEIIHNLTQTLYGPFQTLYETAIYTFLNGTVRSLHGNVNLVGVAGVSVDAWNVNGSALEQELNALQAQVNALQVLVQVTLDGEIVQLQTSAIQHINGVAASNDAVEFFNGGCNLSTSVLNAQTIQFDTCGPVPNAYTCDQQITQTQASVEAVQQAQQNLTQAIQVLEQYISTFDTSVIRRINQNQGPHVVWQNSSTVQVRQVGPQTLDVTTRNIIKRFTNALNVSTDANNVTITSGTSGVYVNGTTNITISAASGLDNLCGQYPDPSITPIFFTGVIGGNVVDTWRPVLLNGFIFGPSNSQCTCTLRNASIEYCTVFADNCPTFPKTGDPTNCAGVQGWSAIQVQFGDVNSAYYLRFTVPNVGTVWSIQMKIQGDLTPGVTLATSTIITFGLIDLGNNFPTSTLCNGPLVASFASSMTLVTTTPGLPTSRAYYYGGEITFSTQDVNWTPGNVYWVCYYFSGPSTLFFNAEQVFVEPTLVRIV